MIINNILADARSKYLVAAMIFLALVASCGENFSEPAEIKVNRPVDLSTLDESKAQVPATAASVVAKDLVSATKPAPPAKVAGGSVAIVPPIEFTFLTTESANVAQMPITWQAYPGASKYKLILGHDSQCSDHHSEFDTVASSQRTGFLNDGKYFACVTAIDPTGHEIVTTASAPFNIFATLMANPLLQNGVGGSGTALITPLVAPQVLFQNDFTSKLVNRDGTVPKRSGASATYSIGAYSDPNDGYRLKLFVNDRDNNRILIFNKIPLSGSTDPDVVVGQNTFDSGLVNNGGNVSGFGFNAAMHASVCADGKMLISDRGNNRVLVYGSIPTANGVAADFALGQPDVTTGTLRSTSSSSMNQPYAAYCVADKVLVLDKGNNRILVYSALGLALGALPLYVIGQPDMNSNTTGCTSSKLNSPYEIGYYQGKLYIADGGNHRVLVYNSMPVAAGAAADVVIGQQDMISCSQNRGAALPSDGSLAFPNSLAFKDGKVAVSDHSNNRIVIYTLPVTTGQLATWVLGQTDFVTATTPSTPSATQISSPKGLIFDKDYVWVGDSANARVITLPLPPKFN